MLDLLVATAAGAVGVTRVADVVTLARATETLADRA